jgi:hypothetical protein
MAEGWNKGRRAVDVDRDDNKGPDDSLDQLIDLQGQRDWFAKMSKPKNMRNGRQKAAKDAIKRLPVAEEATKKLSKDATVYHKLLGTGTVVDFSTGPGAYHWVDVKFFKDRNTGKPTRVDRKQLTLEKVESVAEEIEMKKIIGYKVIDTEGKEVIGKNGKVLIIPIRNYEIDGRYYELQGYEFEPVWSQPTQDMAEGINISNELKNIRSKSTKELDNLILFYTKALEFNPKFQQNRDLLDLVKMVRQERKRMNEQDMAESNQQVNESYYPMGKQGSYSDAVPTTKIIIQHSRRIEEGEQRYRNIAKIFVENSEGERFAVPTNKPGLARVYARHIAEGGTPYDERGRHITSLVEEYSKMSGFMRATRGKQFNESAQQLVTEAVNYYQSLRESLSKMTGHRGYSAYFESWTPALMEDGEEQETNLNELFVQETLDPRIESVMPILGKLQRKLGNIKQVDELAEWADNIIEGDGGQEALNPIGIPETTDVTDDNPKSQGGTRKELLRKYANTKKPKDAEAARRAGASQSELKTAADSTEEIHEGASSQDLQNAILYRVEMRHPELFSKYGHEYVADKALDVASFYAGAEEIGSSDISAMVNHLVDTLKREGENGLDENLAANQKRVGQLGPTEKAKSISPVLGAQSKQHPFKGKLVGANENVNESFKKKDNTDIKLSWSSLDEGLSVSDKLHIFEEYYTKGNLTESNNQDTTDYFVSLFSLSDKPTKNKKYIVVPLSLVGDRILLLDKPGYMEYLGKGMDTQLIFKSNSGEVGYPSETMRNLSTFYTFTFQTQEAYDKFRTALTLKFDADLPNIKLTKMEEDLGANESVNESEDELARILQMVKHKR